MGFFSKAKELFQKGKKAIQQGFYKLGEAEAKGLQRIGILKANISSPAEQIDLTPTIEPKLQELADNLEIKGTTDFDTPEPENEIQEPIRLSEAQIMMQQYQKPYTNQEKNKIIRGLYDLGYRAESSDEWYNQIEELTGELDEEPVKFSVPKPAKPVKNPVSFDF